MVVAITLVTDARSNDVDACIGLGLASRRVWKSLSSAQTNARDADPPGVPRRGLGDTRETVSPIALGGWHLRRAHGHHKLRLRILRTAIDDDIKLMDKPRDRHDGPSEKRMGKALRHRYREKD